MAKRVQSREAARILGLSIRSVQGMAIRGEIPSAARIGARWTFDVERLQSWIKELEAENCRKFSFKPLSQDRAASRFVGPPSDEAYERALKFKE